MFISLVFKDDKILISGLDNIEVNLMSAALQNLVNQPYKHGFVTDIESDVAPKGLNEDIIRVISSRKDEPEWLLEFRLNSYYAWLEMTEPDWKNCHHPKIDFQSISSYAAPIVKLKLNSMDEVDPELLHTFEKLGVPLHERMALEGVAVDVIFDSVSVATTTYKDKLAEVGIIFCSMSEAVREHPELVRKYLGTVVPSGDNFYAALNSAVFTDGSFCFIPKGVKCPMDLSTYFRINTEESGQFERTLIIAEDDATVSYLGFTKTDLQGHIDPKMLAGMTFMEAWQGSLSTINAATKTDVQQGKYYGPDGQNEVGEFLRWQLLTTRLWTMKWPIGFGVKHKYILE